jgi:DNA-binding transcriptional MerR regulator
LRISELSRASGVPIPTIKWYLREGLLQPGTATAANQADYGPAHLHRLRLVRTLVEIGGLGTPAVRAVLEAIDDAELPMHSLLGVAQRALGPAAQAGPVPDDVARARAEVDSFLAELGWSVSAEAPARRALADALAALWRLGRDAGAEVFAPHAEAADRLAAQELDRIPTAGSRAETVERVVVGTVVYEAALVALRRLAHEHHSSLRAAPTGQGEPSRLR